MPIWLYAWEESHKFCFIVSLCPFVFSIKNPRIGCEWATPIIPTLPYYDILGLGCSTYFPPTRMASILWTRSLCTFSVRINQSPFLLHHFLGMQQDLFWCTIAFPPRMKDSNLKIPSVIFVRKTLHVNVAPKVLTLEKLLGFLIKNSTASWWSFWSYQQPRCESK